jgi:monoamine oxidase
MVDVAVVGAGLSGLACAYRLAQTGLDVLVLEARERVGGRTWRVSVGDSWYEGGAEVLDHEHGALRGLAEELGVAVVEGPAWAGDTTAGLEGAELELFQELEAEVQRLAVRIDPHRPEELDEAGRLDRQTLAGWLAEQGASEHVLSAAETWISVASSSVSTRHMSLLAYATKTAAGAAPTGLRLRLAGGPTALAQRLAEELEGRIRLGVAVTGLEQDDARVSVHLADGGGEKAERAVLALPLTLQRDLHFGPPLPEHRLRALSEARYGDAVKEAAVFDTPPPLELPAVTPDGVVYSPNDDRRLVVRFAGAGAAEREHELARLAGAEPRATARVRWSRERWSRGSYPILGPGHLTTWARRLGEPHGRVHFAGAERSALRSYMEGAVRGGEQAAAEVLEVSS